jgi:hypothetical protein
MDDRAAARAFPFVVVFSKEKFIAAGQHVAQVMP